MRWREPVAEWVESVDDASVRAALELLRTDKSTTLATFKKEAESFGFPLPDKVLSKKGKSTPTMGYVQALAVFDADPAWDGVLGYDECREEMIYLKPPPPECGVSVEVLDDPKSMPPVVEETHLTRFGTWFAQVLDVKVSINALTLAALANVRQRLFDWMRDRYFANLPEWDGTQRLRTELPTLFGVDKDDAKMAGVFLEKQLIASVRRTYHPGTKVDSMVMLVGGQGAGKTEGVAKLLPHDELFSIVTGKPHGPNTNEDQFLVDVTGNRRYWPVRIVAARDQLWAEAKHLADKNEPHWLSRKEEAEARRLQSEHMVEVPLSDELHDLVLSRLTGGKPPKVLPREMVRVTLTCLHEKTRGEYGKAATGADLGVCRRAMQHLGMEQLPGGPKKILNGGDKKGRCWIPSEELYTELCLEHQGKQPEVLVDNTETATATAPEPYTFGGQVINPADFRDSTENESATLEPGIVERLTPALEANCLNLGTLLGLLCPHGKPAMGDMQYRTTEPRRFDFIHPGERVSIDELEQRWRRNAAPKPHTVEWYQHRIDEASSPREARGWVRAKAAFEAEQEEAAEFAALKKAVGELERELAEAQELLAEKKRADAEARRKAALDSLLPATLGWTRQPLPGEVGWTERLD